MINLQSALMLAMRNNKNLKICAQAGCYQCNKIYPVTEIKDFTDQGETAVCPYCQIDAVIPDSCGITLTTENLIAIKKHWFN